MRRWPHSFKLYVAYVETKNCCPIFSHCQFSESNAKISLYLNEKDAVKMNVVV